MTEKILFAGNPEAPYFRYLELLMDQGYEVTPVVPQGSWYSCSNGNKYDFLIFTEGWEGRLGVVQQAIKKGLKVITLSSGSGNSEQQDPAQQARDLGAVVLKKHATEEGIDDKVAEIIAALKEMKLPA